MLRSFKSKWEITENWQLLFPFLGVLGLAYSAFKLSFAVLHTLPTWLILLVSVFIFYGLLKLTLFIFSKLKHKWVVDQRWEMIRIFIVFAITGSSSMFIGRPLIALMGITKENLNPLLYWFLFIIIGLIFYQILLVFFGWLFGQFKFFWEFEKKMLSRFGLGWIVKE